MGTFHISVAGKSRLPSIKDKYSYRMGSAIPNPDLQAERSVNYECGYAGTLSVAAWKANVFYNDVTNYILLKTIPDPTSPGRTTTQNQNVGRVRLYGAELGTEFALLEHLEGGADYTLLYTENQSTSDKLVDLPQHKAIVYLRYTFLEAFKALADGEYDTKRYSSSDANRMAGEFVVLNLKLQYELLYNWVAEAGVKNLLDRNYAYQEGYPEPGRNYFVKMNYRF
jgi:iron complex outermembrane receptor protein